MYLGIVGPFYSLFGLGMALYFASQGTGNMVMPFTAGVVRLCRITLTPGVVRRRRVTLFRMPSQSSQTQQPALLVWREALLTHPLHPLHPQSSPPAS